MQITKHVIFVLKCQDHLDVFGVVQEMRRERVWMVQTEQQYICIHQCILAVLQVFQFDVSNDKYLLQYILPLTFRDLNMLTQMASAEQLAQMVLPPLVIRLWAWLVVF
jgi:hypothetical protein